MLTENVYINGEWIETGDEIASQNPANTQEVVARVSKGNRGTAKQAIDASVEAQDEWKSLTQPERGSYLRDAAEVVEERFDEIVDLVVRELGKTEGSARGEVQRTVDLLNYYAEVARDKGGIAPPSASQQTLTYTKREPWGTAGVITPWNFPIAIPTWKIAPALVAGNTVVFKPASLTPGTAAALVQAFDKADLPAGVLNFVPGSGSEVGDEIVTSDSVDVVSFTGSSRVGKHVYESAVSDGKRVQTEMGGKNPIIVDETADIEHAVQLTISGAFSGIAGQACTATSRAIVFEEVYDEYLEQLIKSVEDLTVANPTESDPNLGPKVSQSELDSDLEYIAIGENEGATLAVGGDQLTGGEYEDGFFVEPTVFTEVEPDMRIAQEEIFGPVLAVLSVSGFEEAISVANGVDYGLTASLCTNDLSRTQRFTRDIETGVVKVNQTSTGVGMQMPFGGRKQSSSETFKEQGRQALEFFSHEKAVYVTHLED
ncbi:aldehyde dehydrogenase family protein [Halobellus litoreus]|uniref:Aldehyde dehydrogenase family protein n=1 Tax=Halobellus litoreus TaxID=755310 RepID=A0ABD6DYU1_9EURY|nr:aldehyde dehydrogenase family protein [Halobellus litoreus]